MTWTFKVFWIISISCPYQDRWMGTLEQGRKISISHRSILIRYQMIGPINPFFFSLGKKRGGKKRIKVMTDMMISNHHPLHYWGLLIHFQ
jgi:hypothetical protein